MPVMFTKAGLLAFVALLAASPAMPVAAQPVAVAGSTLAWKAGPSSGPGPAPRHESAAAYLDGKFYLIGGRGNRPIDILDLQTNQWRKGAAPPTDIHHTQAVAFDGRIHVIGALTGGFPEEGVVPRLLTYDPATDRWNEGAELPVERRRGAGGLVVHEGIFYLVGGNRRGHNSGYVPWLDSFDPGTGAWTALPDAPQARDHFHAAVLNGKIYAPAGRTSAADQGDAIARTVAHMDVYDIAARRWTTAKDPIPTPRSGVGVAAMNGLVVVLGGESGGQQSAHVEVEAYDPAADAWTRLSALPVPRHGAQAVVVGEALHIVGGSRNRGGGPELADHWILGGN